jgi:hypothetical protein
VRGTAIGGADLAALDLDLVLVEFDHGKPCGLIEFKRNTVDVDLQHPSMRTLAKLADGCAIPFIVARYQVELWCFEALPGNAIAHRLFRRGWLTEAEFVGHLYKLRGRPIPPDVLPWLRCDLPPREASGLS